MMINILTILWVIGLFLFVYGIITAEISDREDDNDETTY
jgi:hypothetical protein